MDGAIVNFGRHSEVLTQLKKTQNWLITIHCAIHRVELALTESFAIPVFKKWIIYFAIVERKSYGKCSSFRY